MKKLNLTTPFDHELARFSGWSRKHWEESFYKMMVAIMKSSSSSGARQILPGPRSHHGRVADEVEGFSRSFIMAGPWLINSGDGKFHLEGQEYDVAAFYRRGILAGTDPAHPEYWGDLYDYAQHLVELASVAWALYQGRVHIWDKFTRDEQDQVAAYLYQCTKVTYHQNNWLLFNVITNTVLKKFGMPCSQEQIDKNLDFCDSMYMGGGWYRDGDVNRIDYYNAWAFLYYYLIWVILDGESKPEIAEKHKDRARLFVRDFRYFLGSDGAVPAFGRSMIYRFGYLSVVALGQYLDILDIPPGEVRTMTGLGVKFYMDQEIFTNSGHLSMGYLRPCAEILENYSCGGSPYWAVKAYNILMIPSSDEFWRSREEPLPIHQGDFHKGMEYAGLVLSGHKETGHVQLFNQKSRHDNPEYNGKYTKFAYSTVFSYEARKVWGNFNCDNILQFSEDRINFSQRWKMEPLLINDRLSISRYPLYKVDEEGEVVTAIVLKDDFYLTLHRIRPTRNLCFTEGGYALGFDDGQAEILSEDGCEYAAKDGKITFLKNLYGWQETIPAAPFNDDVQTTNVRYMKSVVPKLYYDMNKPADGDIYLAALFCGRVSNVSLKDCSALVGTIERKGTCFSIKFYDGETVDIELEQ
ncbi:MAG: DUF2264 domain-containing protein [Spirochaetales bacterium]|nr:DUF2264 domain-containing protein [Spirochaetales bacterium]